MALIPPPPARPPGPAQFVEVPGAQAIPTGTGLMARVDGKVIALFRLAEGWRAVQNACPHTGAPLAKGSVRGETVTCPRDGWEFDLSTGTCLTHPQARVECYPVRIEDGRVLVRVWDGAGDAAASRRETQPQTLKDQPV